MTRKRSIAIGVGIGLVLAIALWLAASPYLTLRQMQQAVAAQDAQTVSDHVDFVSLRASIKQQTTRELAQNATRRGKPAIALALATAGTDRMIDTFVQPSLITMMLADARSTKNPVGGKIVGPDVKVTRTGIARFEVTGSRPGAVIFELQGLTWKLVGVEARPAR